MNPTIFQAFHWYYSPEGNLWNHIAAEAPRLAGMGFTHVWLPPAYKSAQGVDEPGYAVYDLYDLGEFDQKGSVRTLYGTREEYLHCIEAIHAAGMKVLTDIVLNHRTGGDEKEKIYAHYVNEQDRTTAASEEVVIEAHTRFLFPGRNHQYSDFEWNQQHFTGVCEDGHIALIHHQYSQGNWDNVPDSENGNFDYLMGCDVEFRNPEVREELKRWGEWYAGTTQTDGFRLDAIKHISTDFFPEWLEHLKQHFQKDFECIGEYWKSDLESLRNYIQSTQRRIRLFDVPLHFNFYDASMKGRDFSLPSLLDNTLLKEDPEMAVTFVDNHDTQPLQSLESTVDYWFKPIAYALILLREQGLPVIFYPALYEAHYSGHRGEEEVFIELNKVNGLEILVEARAKYAYGMQRDYFDHPNVIGWTREGIGDRPESGCAVLISNSEEGFKRMSLGATNAGKIFRAIYGNREEKVTLDEQGEGEFKVNPGSVSVWVKEG